MAKNIFIVISLLSLVFMSSCEKENLTKTDWDKIKANATFTVYDNSYDEPVILPLHVGGWEDGLYVTRDGLNLYSTYMPLDVFSLLDAFVKDPECFDYTPYYRPPLLDVDMVTNPWGCENFFQSDVIISQRSSDSDLFLTWNPSNIKKSVSNEGAACGVLKNKDSFDVFVFTQNPDNDENMEIMFMKNTSVNPDIFDAVPIVSSSGAEDNPHIERLEDNSLLLFFDRERFVYYSFSYDEGNTWTNPVKVTNIINDHAPYDIQPHLWNDGTNWWLYFCKDNENGVRSIYRTKQQTPDDWNSWGTPEIVIEPQEITGDYGTIIGVGEPSLTDNGDMYFVVIYGNLNSDDETDVFDCDPWLLPKK